MLCILSPRLGGLSILGQAVQPETALSNMEGAATPAYDSSPSFSLRQLLHFLCLENLLTSGAH
jgi:hypothetical protein